MSDSLSPIGKVAPDRRAGRRVTDPLVAAAEAEAAIEAAANLPVPLPPVPDPVIDAAFEAQLLGQEGQKRGLKGGAPVLDQARNTYLGAEWSGKSDRRPPQGLFTKTTV